MAPQRILGMKLAATFALLLLLFCMMMLPMHWRMGSLSTTGLVLAELLMLAGAAGLAWWIRRAFKASRKWKCPPEALGRPHAEITAS
jgi:hypothetical protein